MQISTDSLKPCVKYIYITSVHMHRLRSVIFHHTNVNYIEPFNFAGHKSKLLVEMLHCNSDIIQYLHPV